MSILRSILDHTLNSVVFGIILMVSIASYIAIGSGLPSVRERFEMNELAFFAAWPFKLLTLLLVLNLIVVTLRRIPFTPPRYGVWAVHAGIIILVSGLSAYYLLKSEGLAFVGVGKTARVYYDGFERSLYARIDNRLAIPLRLPDLPRFKTHVDERYFADRDLVDKLMEIRVPDARNESVDLREVGSVLGLAAPLQMDVVGYYPYADVVTTWEPSATGQAAVSVTDARNAGVALTLGSEGGASGRARSGRLEIEHRRLPSVDDMKVLEVAAKQLHRLSATHNGIKQELQLQPGETYSLFDGRYTISVEDFIPQWNTIDKTTVPAMSLLISKPGGASFRRMVLSENPTQTDFKLDVVDAGPMGERQKTPIDPELSLAYRFADPLAIMPKTGTTQLVLLSNDASPMITALVLSKRRPLSVSSVEGGGHLDVIEAGEGFGPMIMSDEAERHLDIASLSHVSPVQRVVEVPREQRQGDVGQSGMKQVIALRLRCGDWQTTQYVPFSQWTAEMPWASPPVVLPSGTSVQLQLGNTQLPLPMLVRLDEFKAVPYMGGGAGGSGMMRDFESHITLFKPDGTRQKDVVRLNTPVFLKRGGITSKQWLGESFLYSQAQWDPEGQKFTVLGVANRPAVSTMTLGCVLIVGGLLWAFYVKPILIARKKSAALIAASAQPARNSKASAQRAPELVET